MTASSCPLTTDPQVVRVAILNAFTPTRDALWTVVDAERGVSVVGAACNGAEAISVVRAHRAHVLLLDGAMSWGGGLDALRQLRGSGTGVPAVVLVDSLTGADAVNALRLGARGILLKEQRLRVLFECLRAVAEGAYWVGNERVRNLAHALRRVREAGHPEVADRRLDNQSCTIANAADLPTRAQGRVYS